MTKSDVLFVILIQNAADFAQIFQFGKQKKPAWNIAYPDEPSSLSLLLNVSLRGKCMATE